MPISADTPRGGMVRFSQLKAYVVAWAHPNRGRGTHARHDHIDHDCDSAISCHAAPARATTLIPNYASPIGSPTTWSGTGYGYNVSGGAAISAFSGSKYAHFGSSASPDSAASHSSIVTGTPTSGEVETVTLKVVGTATQPAGSYTSATTWTCLPIY
jgi:hypothetical protein